MAEENGIQNLVQQAKALTPMRQLLLIATGLGSLAFFGWLATGVGQADERLLYGGLQEDETARVVEVLAAEKIPYRLVDGGSIRVPAAVVHEARIRVAARGLPGGSGVGFEIFDKPAFGVTDFVHRVNYKRALQGELARSITQLESVLAARVQIAQPERRGFVDDGSRAPSAAVVVKLRPGWELDAGQVRGIVHVVASSVEGLDSGRVTVVDNRGRLHAPTGGELGPSAPEGALDHQRGLEQVLGKRIESILARVVGNGGVVAHVSAELDFTEREVTEERYDPNTQVARSEQFTNETSSDSSATPGGTAGIVSNEPGAAAAGGSGSSSTSSERKVETINYEISKTVSHSVEQVGEVKRLHVAVLVDGVPAEDGSVTPFDATRLGEFEELAKHAVGFSAERGDQITVTSVPFRSVELPAEEGGSGLDPSILGLAATAAQALALLLGIFLVARLVVKPLADAARSGAGAMPMTAQGLEAQLQGGDAALSGVLAPGVPAAPGVKAPPPPPATLAEQVGQVAVSRSDDSVRTLQNWLAEG